MKGVRTGVLAAFFLSGTLAAHAQQPAAPHQHGASQSPAPPMPTANHAAHQDPVPLPPFIAPVTDADRQAAFPDVQGHSVHDNAVNYFVLFDQFEGQAGDGPGGFSWDTKGWVGRDRNRLWF